MADAAAKNGDSKKKDEAWSAPRLLGVGGLAFLAALAVIVYMGSRYEGCMYLDGSRPGHAVGR